MPYFVLAKLTEKGKLYVKSHRRCNKAIDGMDVSVDPDVSKALIFGREENAVARAKLLSDETTSIFVAEPVRIAPRPDPEFALAPAPDEIPAKPAPPKPTKASK